MQYLERALQGKTGKESDEIKDQLRKYFPTRDCCTMVRPIVDEQKIQSLNSIPIEDLRPEFVQQSFALRNKIINGMIPKKINGS